MYYIIEHFIEFSYIVYKNVLSIFVSYSAPCISRIPSMFSITSIEGPLLGKEKGGYFINVLTPL